MGEVKAYDLATRAKRAKYHATMERIRAVNGRIMRKGLRSVFKQQLTAIKGLDDPGDMSKVALAVHQTDGRMRDVFTRAYMRTARDVFPLLQPTSKTKGLLITGRKDAISEYFDVVLRQWVEAELGIKIVKVQQTTLAELRKAYETLSNGYDINAPQADFRDEVIKAFVRTYDTNISTFRANCIARTECAAATNRAALETTKAIGGEPRKQWLSVLDLDTRDTHRHMDGRLADIDGLFDVNGSMMECPLDSTHGAHVREIANCRCDIGFKYD